MDLFSYMESGVRTIEARVGKYYIHNKEGRRFLKAFVPALNRSSDLRRAYEAQGLHVPQFLICSITTRCNLHCAGCYARAGGICSDDSAGINMLSGDEWLRIFREAEQAGVSFILLAGGEPLLRRDVLEAAASIPGIAFPIFTNGTLLDESYLELFAANRNLIPVLSIEGDSAATDARRGKGVSASIEKAADALNSRGILYATSTTVTSQNLRDVVTRDYLAALRQNGCGLAFYIEYVPAAAGTDELVLSPEDAVWLNAQVNKLRDSFPDMCLFSFPGDEAYTDGCLAAGRGFFHINPAGGAEPCPFSPYAGKNLQNSSLLEVLASDYFTRVQRIAAADTAHDGGCTLFRHADEVRQLMEQTK